MQPIIWGGTARPIYVMGGATSENTSSSQNSVRLIDRVLAHRDKTSSKSCLEANFHTRQVSLASPPARPPARPRRSRRVLLRSIHSLLADAARQGMYTVSRSCGRQPRDMVSSAAIRAVSLSSFARWKKESTMSLLRGLMSIIFGRGRSKSVRLSRDS